MYRTALQETHFSRQRERGGVIRAGASSYLCMQQYVCCWQSLHTDSRLLDVQHSLLYVTLNITVILRSKQTLTLMFLLSSFIVTGSIPPATAVVYLSIGISWDGMRGTVLGCEYPPLVTPGYKNIESEPDAETCQKPDGPGSAHFLLRIFILGLSWSSFA